tara:strand:+ start:1558 stop:1875 length:318 start_codon:yes stop_codon:yes gene_type:complete
MFFKTDNNLDYYGFSNDDTKQLDSQMKPIKTISVQKYILNVFLICMTFLIVLILLSMTIISAYYAWNEFPLDSLIHKIIKSFMAGLFSPIYMSYLFMKLHLFKKK